MRPGEVLNMDYERHHRSAEATGKPVLSIGMQKALDIAYKQRKAPDIVVGRPCNYAVKSDELG